MTAVEIQVGGEIGKQRRLRTKGKERTVRILRVLKWMRKSDLIYLSIVPISLRTSQEGQ